MYHCVKDSLEKACHEALSWLLMSFCAVASTVKMTARDRIRGAASKKNSASNQQPGQRTSLLFGSLLAAAPVRFTPTCAGLSAVDWLLILFQHFTRVLLTRFDGPVAPSRCRRT